MQSHVRAETGMSLEQATPKDYWTALAKSIVELISENWMSTRQKYNKGRQAHYFSAEFLEGRSMLNNLVNLGIYDQAKDALASFGLDITDILEEETDPALGNGGLGHLAACFLDSCATLNLPVTGYGTGTNLYVGLSGFYWPSVPHENDSRRADMKRMVEQFEALNPEFAYTFFTAIERTFPIEHQK